MCSLHIIYCPLRVLLPLSGIRTRSGSTESDGSSEDDDITTKDNRIRATWSRVAALHCVMLPERMADYFRAPHLPVLASRFMDQTQAVSGEWLTRDLYSWLLIQCNLAL